MNRIIFVLLGVFFGGGIYLSASNPPFTFYDSAKPCDEYERNIRNKDKKDACVRDIRFERGWQ